MPGTIYSAAEEMVRAGGRALAVAAFGGIDILVNNASALA